MFLLINLLKRDIYLAQPPLFKINKGSKGIYIKDEKVWKNIYKKSKILSNLKKEQKNTRII